MSSPRGPLDSEIVNEDAPFRMKNSWRNHSVQLGRMKRDGKAERVLVSPSDGSSKSFVDNILAISSMDAIVYEGTPPVSHCIHKQFNR